MHAIPGGRGEHAGMRALPGRQDARAPGGKGGARRDACAPRAAGCARSQGGRRNGRMRALPGGKAGARRDACAPREERGTQDVCAPRAGRLQFHLESLFNQRVSILTGFLGGVVPKRFLDLLPVLLDQIQFLPRSSRPHGLGLQRAG
jgi:hypothetical protein